MCSTVRRGDLTSFSTTVSSTTSENPCGLRVTHCTLAWALWTNKNAKYHRICSCLFAVCSVRRASLTSFLTAVTSTTSENLCDHTEVDCVLLTANYLVHYGQTKFVGMFIVHVCLFDCLFVTVHCRVSVH